MRTGEQTTEVIDLAALLEGHAGPLTIVLDAPPSVIRYEGHKTDAIWKKHTGYSIHQSRRLARTNNFPLRVRGHGKGKREHVVLDEVLQWWRDQRRSG